MKIIPLSCPNCGASIQVPDGMQTLTCSRCGTQSIVERGEGYVNLKMLDEIKEVMGGVSSELAIVRLKKEIPALEAEVETLREGVAEIGRQIREKGRQQGARAVAIFALGVALVFFILWVMRVAFKEYLCLGSGFLFVMAGALLLSDRSRASRQAKLEKEQEALQAELMAKEAEIAAKAGELERHREAVSG